MESKEKKDVRCKGRMPETRKPCEAVLYQTDGEFLYINGLILNQNQRRQRIKCAKCETVASWTRNPKFDKKDSLLPNKFTRKIPPIQKNY